MILDDDNINILLIQNNFSLDVLMMIRMKLVVQNDNDVAQNDHVSW